MGIQTFIPAAVAATLLGAGGCGHRLEPLGVIADGVGMTKTSLGPSPGDLPMAEYVTPSSDARVRHADVAGDEAAESLVEIFPGPGAAKGGVEVRDQKGTVITRIATSDYLTDFGAVRASRSQKFDVIIYTYPNAKKGGTFAVLSIPDRTEVATWDEYPPPSRLAVENWDRQPAVFYARGDEIVVRSPSGEMAKQLDLPGAGTLSRIHVTTIRSGHKVIVASGNGYTPFHIVALFTPDGVRVFQENGNEHAFRLEGSLDGDAFDVWTRSQKWRYTPALNSTACLRMLTSRRGNEVAAAEASAGRAER